VSSRYRATTFVPLSDPGYQSWRAGIRASQKRRAAQKAALRVASSSAVISSAADPSPISSAPVILPAPSVVAEPVPAGPSAVQVAVPLVATDAERRRENAARSAYAGDAEYFIRRKLKGELAVSDNRVLRYEEYRSGRFFTSYRELDVVVFDSDRLYIFEIKASRNLNTVRYGIEQLSTARSILEGSSLPVITTLIVVDTSDAAPDGESDIAGFLARSPRITLVPWVTDLTDIPTVHGIRLLPEDVQAMSHRPLDMSWNHAA